MKHGKTNNPKGRPRIFGERETISLALPGDLIKWADAMAKQAGISRTRLLTEVIDLVGGMCAFGFVRVTREETTFRQCPNPEIGRKWLKPEYQALAAGVTISSSHGKLERSGVARGFSVEDEMPSHVQAETDAA